MAVNGLRDQDRLDGASNFVIWKAKILAILDKHRIKDYALKIVAIPIGPAANEKYELAEAQAKCMILDGVKDHAIPHITEKNTAREMWEALTKLYQHTFVQRKMLLENQLRSYQMQKGSCNVTPYPLYRVGKYLTICAAAYCRSHF